MELKKLRELKELKTIVLPCLNNVDFT